MTCSKLLYELLIFSFLFCIGHGESSESFCGNPNINSRKDLEQIIQYPSYPNIKQSYLECWYTVSAPNGTRIRFWFDSFGIKTYNSSFYIWCYNVEKSSEKFLELNKQNQERSMFHSASNIMKMKLRVPRNYNYTGFRFRTMAVVSFDTRLEAYTDAQLILSPGYPFKHPTNHICLWTIVAASNHVITLTANQTTNESCCVRFKVDNIEVSIKKGSVFQSSGNKLILEFVSYNSIKNNPFLFYYTSERICGEEKFYVTDLVQNFQASSYPNISSKTLNCGYKFISTEGTRIRFKIKDFGIKKFHKNYFYLHVYDGLCENNERFLALNQKNQAFTTFHSRSNVMFMKLNAYKSDNYTGFIMSYQAIPSCGSQLTATDFPKTLSSPRYPKAHLADLVCTWTISAPVDHAVVLNIKYLSQEVCCTYIEAVESTPVIQATRLNSSSTYRSNGNKMKITFVAQNSLQRSGFKLVYIKDSICGQTTLKAEIDVEESLKAPAFPVIHSDWLNCWYTITAVKHTRIRFWIKSLGFAENHSKTSLSFYNHLKNNIDSFLSVHDFSHINKMHHSKSNYLGIKLQTYRYDYYKGFHINYMAVESCGGNVVAISNAQNISTPGYPKRHRSNFICSWNFTSIKDYLVEVKTYFVSNNTCCEESQIIEPYNVHLQSNQTYLTKPTGPTMLISYIAHNKSIKSGLLFSIKAVSVCNQSDYKAEVDVMKYIEHPGFVASSTLIRCWYNIIAPLKTRILYWFDKHGLNRPTYGARDWIKVYSGLNGGGYYIRYIYSWDRTGVMYETSKNYVGFEMRIHQRSLFSGLKIRYMAVDSCGANLIAPLTYETISTPNFPAHYKSNLLCTWTIKPPDHHLIQFNVISVSSDNHNEVLQGRILHLNKLKANRTYISSGYNDNIRFFSLNSKKREGFQMKFKSLYVCGKTKFKALSDQEKVFPIPLFPPVYDSYTTSCWYAISAPLYKIVRLWLKKDAMLHLSYYHRMKISLYNGLELKGQPYFADNLHNYNGRLYHSETNLLGILLDVHFRPPYKHPRYNISYMAVDGCGGILAAGYSSYQKIVVPGYPHQYQSKRTCTWKIVARISSLIALKVIKISNNTRYETTLVTKPEYEVLKPNQLFYGGKNLMTINYILTNTSLQDGIELAYKAVPVCGESTNLIAEIDVEKSMKTLYHLGSNWHYYFCTYTITAPKKTRIQFHIKQIGEHKYYRNYYSDLSFYNNLDKENGRFLQFNYTHKHEDKMYYSQSSFLTMYFKGYRYYFRDFQLLYKAVDTYGSTLIATENFQSLSTPGYPFPYRSNSSSTWNITATSSYIIRIIFVFISSEKCCETLQVTSPTKFTPHSNQSYQSFSKFVLLEFTSYLSKKRNGFQLLYKSEHICGTLEMKAEYSVEKEFQSSGFPTNYDQDLFICWYTINSPNLSKIKFTIKSLGIEQSRYSRYYKLQIYDQMNNLSSQLLTFNSKSPLGQINYSEHNSILIKLRVHKSDKYTGLKITYEAIESCRKDLNVLTTPQILRPCSNASEGIYKWVLRAPCDHVIQIVPLQVFNRTENQEIFVKSGLKKIYIIKGRNYTSPQRTANIEVLAQKSNETHQFMLRFSAVHICGTRNLEARLDEKQHVHQPAQPLGYSSRMSCLYTVRSPPGTKIQFSFASFGVNVYDSSYFNIKFYDGLTEEGKHFLAFSLSTDVNKIRYSRDNAMTFRVRVDSTHVIYTGFAMFYSAVAIEKFSYLNVRVNFTTTYRVSVNSTTTARYLLDEFNTIDLSLNVFNQMKNEAKLKPHLVAIKPSESFIGIQVRLRVDLIWTFEMTLNNDVIERNRLSRNQRNDVTMMIFSQIREDSASSQLVNIDFSMSEVVSGSTLFIVRVDFQFTYKVLLINSLANVYGFEQTIRNEINSEVYKRLSGVANYIQLMKLNEKVIISEERLMVRVDQTRLYNLSLSSTQQNNFKLNQESLIDLSLSVFIQVRCNAELVQLIGWKTAQWPQTRFIIRVNYTISYSCVFMTSAFKKYGFDMNVTNDISDSLFNEIRFEVIFLQLIKYQPTAPIPPLAKVVVEYNRSYLLSSSGEVRKKFFLSLNEVNEVSSSVFSRIRLLANSAQLEQIITTAGGNKSEENIYILIRADYEGKFMVSLPQAAINEYQLLINQTNDVTRNILDVMKKKYHLLAELVKKENVTLSGSRIRVCVNGTHNYHLYLPKTVIMTYQFTNDSMNNISRDVFSMFRSEKYICQLNKIQTYVSPTGKKIRIRVDFTRVYMFYVSNEVKVKYQFYLKKMNDISSSVFITLREESYFAELTKIQTPASLPIPVKVRVGYNLKYHVYLSTAVKNTFKLQFNFTNDVSESVFIYLQHQATLYELTGTNTKDPRTQNKFRVRVDHDEIYEVYLLDDDVRSFPLVAGKVNDITTSIFMILQKMSATSQLMSINNNPVTVICRSGSWVYKIVIADTVRVKYQLSLNQTNDVSKPIFNSLREKASSVTLVRSQPQNYGNTTNIKIRIKSSRTYTVYLNATDVANNNLTANQTNDITMATYKRLTSIARLIILDDLKLTEKEEAICPRNKWTKWFNRDDPSGACDCETLPELRRDYPGQICEKPTTFQARLENCLIPYDPTLPNIFANVKTGFQCKNENGRKCFDYEVRFCCP